jgi:hypothetical protein
MNQLTVTLIVAIGLLGGFYGGFKYGQNHPPSSTGTTNTAALAGTASGAGAAGGAGGAGGTGGAGRGAGGGGGAGGAGGLAGSAISGQITAVGSGTITLHESTGQDVTVNVSSARISKTSQGTAADLTPSTQVTVLGSTGSDGTVNATVVSIGGGFGGRGAGAGGGSGGSGSGG